MEIDGFYLQKSSFKVFCNRILQKKKEKKPLKNIILPQNEWMVFS